MDHTGTAASATSTGPGAPDPSTARVAVVTGASSGIGAASARALARDGHTVVLGARRLERLTAIAAEIGGHALALDVTSDESVDAFAREVTERFGAVHVLVNNAGGAKGTDSIEDADLERWRWMYETNVLGTLRVTRALLPLLRASGDALVEVIASIAAVEPYPGGAGYNAAKFGERALTSVLRQELIGEPIRVTRIDPGLVETEFSLVRFDGDADRAAGVYRGMTPLTGEDVAECVRWVASLPAHVNIDEMKVLPRDQVGSREVHRRPTEEDAR